MSISNEIRELLKQEDCDIVGFADLRELSAETRQNFDYGIVMALSYSKETMLEHKNGSMLKYYDEWKAMNPCLDSIAEKTARFLTDKGYKAFAQLPSTRVSDSNWRTILPHKTVSTLSGIGWIGKCAMLVTPEVGSALRLRVVLTNAPVDCGTPIKTSFCNPSCNACVNACPGKAPKGGLWSVETDRDTFFDANACRKAARARAKETLDINETLCGMCISNCPFTKLGLGY